MKELYPEISRLDMKKEHELITVTGGRYAGEEILLTEGEVVWSSSPDPSAVLKGTEKEDLFREKLTHITEIVVCGCGFIGLSVLRLAKFLGWHATALDDREEFTHLAVKEGADQVICGPFRESLKQIHPDSSTCFVVVTRDHDHDKDCLEVILDGPFGYTGVMGSRLRSARMREYLKSKGAEKEKTDRLHMPVGLKIGADTPEEIAVSIIAEIIQQKASFYRGSSIPDQLMKALLSLSGSDDHAALAIVTGRWGSTPREPGARMLVYPDGRTVGTIGGGSMEADVIKEAVRSLKERASFTPHTITIDLTGQQGSPTDMICGGMNEIFLELL